MNGKHQTPFSTLILGTVSGSSNAACQNHMQLAVKNDSNKLPMPKPLPISPIQLAIPHISLLSAQSSTELMQVTNYRRKTILQSRSVPVLFNGLLKSVQIRGKDYCFQGRSKNSRYVPIERQGKQCKDNAPWVTYLRIPEAKMESTTLFRILK